MEAILATIVASLVAGATAKAQDVASQAIMDAYDGLKSVISAKLGKMGAVQSVEDDPESEAAQEALTEALARKNLQTDTELKTLADRLEKAVREAQAAASPGMGEIEVDSVRGRVNAIVEKLVATGRIKIGPVTAETGDARVSELSAGTSRKLKRIDPKKG